MDAVVAVVLKDNGVIEDYVSLLLNSLTMEHIRLVWMRRRRHLSVSLFRFTLKPVSIDRVLLSSV